MKQRAALLIFVVAAPAFGDKFIRSTLAVQALHLSGSVEIPYRENAQLRIGNVSGQTTGRHAFHIRAFKAAKADLINRAIQFAREDCLLYEFTAYPASLNNGNMIIGAKLTQDWLAINTESRRYTDQKWTVVFTEGEADPTNRRMWIQADSISTYFGNGIEFTVRSNASVRPLGCSTCGLRSGLLAVASWGPWKGPAIAPPYEAASPDPSEARHPEICFTIRKEQTGELLTRAMVVGSSCHPEGF